MKPKTSPLQIFCYVILVIPPYGSTFKVTPDPSLPTAEPVIRNGSAGEAVTKL